MTFWEGGTPAGMPVLSQGSRVQTCLPAQGAEVKHSEVLPLIHESDEKLVKNYTNAQDQ